MTLELVRNFVGRKMRNVRCDRNVGSVALPCGQFAATRSRLHCVPCQPALPPSVAIAAEEVVALIEALASRDRRARRLAANALRYVGPAAVPQLTKALRDPRPSVRRGAANVLGLEGGRPSRNGSKTVAA